MDILLSLSSVNLDQPTARQESSIEQNKEEGMIRSEYPSDVEKPLSRTMVFICYVTALLLVIAIVYGFTGIVGDIITKSTSLQVNRLNILTLRALFILLDV